MHHYSWRKPLFEFSFSDTALGDGGLGGCNAVDEVEFAGLRSGKLQDMNGIRDKQMSRG